MHRQATDDNPFKAPHTGRYDRMCCADDPMFSYLRPPKASLADFPEHANYFKENAKRYDQTRVYPKDHWRFCRENKLVDARVRDDDNWPEHKRSQEIIDRTRKLTVDANGQIDWRFIEADAKKEN